MSLWLLSFDCCNLGGTARKFSRGGSYALPRASSATAILCRIVPGSLSRFPYPPSNEQTLIFANGVSNTELPDRLQTLIKLSYPTFDLDLCWRQVDPAEVGVGIGQFSPSAMPNLRRRRRCTPHCWKPPTNDVHKIFGIISQ